MTTVYKDTEYALVADYNFIANNPGWNDGGLWGKQYGGKIGIIQDPFGEAKYLGATAPIVGGMVDHLSLAENKTLYADVFLDEPAPEGSGYYSITHKVMFVWDANALIQAALDAREQNNPLTRPIDLEKTLIGYDPIPEAQPKRYNDPGNGEDFGWIYGMASKQNHFPIAVSKWVRYGDVTAITKDELVKAIMNSNAPAAIKNAVGSMSNIQALPGSSLDLGAVIATDPEKNNAVIPGVNDKDMFYVVPEISDADMEKLRSGHRLTGKTVSVFFTADFKVAGGSVTGQNVGFKLTFGVGDYTSRDGQAIEEVFFGDRDLENPGYSEFNLKGGVGVGSGDPLDIWRVEQRLKYLGFPAIKTGTGNTLKEFTVDGKFGVPEQHALRLFEKVVRYDVTVPNAQKYGPNSTGADGMIESAGAQAKITTDWLNAWNAPHWMQLFASTGANRFAASNSALPGWENKQTGTQGTNIEAYGTSWLRDLMAAKRFAPPSLRGDHNFWFNGAVDANLGQTSGMHKTHDLGMAFDLGISGHINRYIAQVNTHESSIAAISAFPMADWSVANALAYSEALPDVQIPGVENDQQSALRDFFSLYALTQLDGTKNNGTWEELPVANGNYWARAALFGSGLKSGGLISKVHIGGVATYTDSHGITRHENPYPNMNLILDKLGIDASPTYAHHHHFHVYMRPPKPLDIDGKTLLAGDMGTDASKVITNNEVSDVQAAAQTLLLQVNSTIETGDELMFAMDIPYISAQELAVMVAQATTSTSAESVLAAAKQKYDYVFNACMETEHGDPRSAMRGVGPAGMLWIYYQHYNRDIDLAAIHTTLLEGPKHGQIISGVENSYRYDPNPGYLGHDQAIFLAEYGGKRYKIIVTLKVFESFDDTKGTTCPPPKLIKVSTSGTADGISSSGNITVNIANLAGGAVGETTAQSITLDNNAAGHNWYIDYTPHLNEEFLPTSNPYEWQARPGSAADGKMDMLTVLWHEYGHALGLEHTAAGHDLMSTTLTPGVRRLPTPEELAALNPPQSPFAKGGGESGSPSLPLAPFAGLPLLFTRQRKPDVSASDAPQYAVAANATLINGEYSQANGDGTPTGWQTQGSVLVSNGSAVLREVATTQTRLSQVFMVEANDHVLRFTLDGLALDDVNGAPDDAFEVSLNDANTGLPLLGGNGLSHSDAFLNIQSDGTEHKASAVTRTLNQDGSRTYLVDISGITAGTAVHLSFDLIGFGVAGSHITVRDVSLDVLYTDGTIPLVSNGIIIDWTPPPASASTATTSANSDH